jgi:hypothetical protein
MAVYKPSILSAGFVSIFLLPTPSRDDPISLCVPDSTSVVHPTGTLNPHLCEDEAIMKPVLRWKGHFLLAGLEGSSFPPWVQPMAWFFFLLPKEFFPKNVEKNPEVSAFILSRKQTASSKQIFCGLTHESKSCDRCLGIYRSAIEEWPLATSITLHPPSSSTFSLSPYEATAVCFQTRN